MSRRSCRRPGGMPHANLAHARRRPTMAAVASIVVAGCAVACAVGCRAANDAPSAEARAIVARGTGVWDATFWLDRTPRGTVAASDADSLTRRGAVAFVATPADGRHDWLRGTATHAGVYVVDFRPFGFVPEASGPVPVLVARVAASDSLVATTPVDDGAGRLALSGVVAGGGDSVTGTWTYTARAAGGWGGRFTLRRQAAAGR